VPEIAIADSRVRHVRPLRPFGSGRGAPDIDAIAWAPDGHRLAFSVHNDSGKRHKPVGGRAVYVVNVNGSGLRRVTPWKLEAGGLGELDWSPDGSHLLFRSITFASDDPGPSSGDIYTFQPDGTGLRRLTNLAAGTGIQLGSYSPDGSHIVFATNDGGTHSPGSDWPDVFVMHADGTHITPVTRTKNWEGTPQWGAAG
jgi:Tol biopolymer transport system component